MQQGNDEGFQMFCLLIENTIDSDLCIEVQDCIDGNIPVTLALEDFLEKEDCRVICENCKYHI